MARYPRFKKAFANTTHRISAPKTFGGYKISGMSDEKAKELAEVEARTKLCCICGTIAICRIFDDGYCKNHQVEARRGMLQVQRGVYKRTRDIGEGRTAK